MTRNEPLDRSHPAVRPNAKGFTLIELMVVIVILGLLLGVVVPNVFRSLGSATRDTAMNQMRSIGGAIDYYMLENKSLPKSLDELTQPSGKSNEPFLKKIPLDPWNEAYEYRILNAKTKEYQMTSAGEDKQMGTDDDIVFPEKDSK
jgi:general secretion pathway protein G